MSEIFKKPILARGEGVKRVGSGASLPAGTTVIPVANASTYFAQGDPIFLTDDVGGNVGWQGLCYWVTDVAVYVRYPSALYSGTHYVIKPAYSCVLAPDYSEVAPELRDGVENFETNGTEIYRTKTQDTKEIITHVFKSVTAAQWVLFQAFYGAAGGANESLNDVIYSYWDAASGAQNTDRVRLLGIGKGPTVDRGGLIGFELSFQVVLPNEYI